MRRLASNNLFLLPASQLPFKEKWQRIANTLPAGDVLLVAFKEYPNLQRMIDSLVPEIEAGGRRVTSLHPLPRLHAAEADRPPDRQRR